MGRALFYYEWHSRLNRLRSRLRRLRQPKYLFGAVVGGLYFYWYFIGVWFRAGVAGRTPAMLASENLALIESLAALVLLVFILLMWIMDLGVPRETPFVYFHF